MVFNTPMILRRCIITIILLLTALTPQAYSTNRSIAVDSTTQISLLVATPGTEIYELEGHAAMRIQGPGGDITVNWGLFNFDQPNFVYRYVKGETDYGIGAQYTSHFINTYASQGRGVTEIPLNLTPSQVQKVIALVDSTLQPGSNIYRYNYVKDNCSTRPLNIVEQAIGDSITMDVTSLPFNGEVSFRDVMRYYHKYYPWYQFGIDLALGSGIDYPITPHEMAFAPVLLPTLLGKATVGGQPLTSGEPRVLVTAPPWAATPTPWYLTPLFVAILVLAASALITWLDIKNRKVTRWFDSTLFGIYAIMGCVITFLVFVSVHEATSPNLLLLWLNPLALIAAVGIWIKKAKKMVVCYHFVNFVALIILAIAWPLEGQGGNIAFIPLILADALRSISYIYINKCALKTAR